MAHIAFLLLCHKNPDAVVQQVRRLVAAGDSVALHYDRSAPAAEFRKIRAELEGVPNVVFARRHSCGWGDWSLVAATLSAARAALGAFPGASHFYLISGDCRPIKPAEYARAFLDSRTADFIETHDIEKGGWIRTGLGPERLDYRHPFNERRRKALFYRVYGFQRRLGLKRSRPDGLRYRVGSQWWCLRRATLERLFAFLRERPEIVRFFRWSWIPDESFFQTIVYHLVPEREIENRTPTFLMFTDYGVPLTFHDDHDAVLLEEDALFARKIAPDARRLEARLGALYSEVGTEVRVRPETAARYAYLAQRGRVGERGPARAWDSGGEIGDDRELLIFVCKKWHVARRLAEASACAAGFPMLGYVFDDIGAEMPDLGGIDATLAKRHRHRRNLVRLLFDHHGAARLAICADPGNLDLLRDLVAGGAACRILLIDAEVDGGWLRGHTVRIGAATEATPEARLRPVMEAVRNDIAGEIRRIAGAGLPALHRLSEAAPPEAQAAALASFLSIPEDETRAIAAMPDLFKE